MSTEKEIYEKLSRKIPIKRVVETKNSVSLILDKETVLKYSADTLLKPDLQGNLAMFAWTYWASDKNKTETET